MPQIRSRARMLRGGPIALTLLLVATLAVPSFASNHSATGSNFEITDGNATVDGGSANLDWNNPGTDVKVTVKADEPSGSGDNSFGNGSKEDTANPTVRSGSIPPNKSDLKEFGYTIERNNNGQFLHLFWTRVQDPSGTTNMDFEFNQNSCVVGGENNDCADNGVTPERSVDDLLITYDLSKGGTFPTISLRKWTGSAWGPADALDPALATGGINTGTISTNMPKDPTGFHVGSYSARTFGEATVNMTKVFEGATTCVNFGSAYLKSRSSDSFTSALKDFIAPVEANITNCGSIKIVKKDDANAPLAGATFTLYNDNAPVGGTFGDPGAEPAGEDTLLNPSKTCTTALNQAQTEASCTLTSVPFGNYWVVETGVPTGYTGAVPQSVSLSASTTTATLTFSNNRNPASVHVKKEDDAGNPLGGVLFTLHNDDNSDTTLPGTATSHTCTTKDGQNATLDEPIGTCKITGILVAGDYWIVETNPPSGYDGASPRKITLTLGQNLDLTGSANVFVNPRKFKVIVLVCRKHDGSLYKSNVSFDGGASVSSLGSGASLTALGDGSVTQAELCGLGGAVHDNVKRKHDNNSDHSASLGIPLTTTP